MCQTKTSCCHSHPKKCPWKSASKFGFIWPSLHELPSPICRRISVQSSRFICDFIQCFQENGIKIIFQLTVYFSSSVLWVIVWLKLVYNRCFGTTYRSQFQSVHCSSWTFWPLKMGPLCISEIPILNQLKHRNNPKDGRIEINNQLENV